MTQKLNTPEILYRAYQLLRQQSRSFLPYIGLLLLCYALANFARAIFPGVYTFDPFDIGWLLIPESLILGPLIALLHHRILGLETSFAWSRTNLTIKFFKAGAYYYLISILALLGFFAATQAIPALAGFALGPQVARFYPIIVCISVFFLLPLLTRLLLVFPFLAGNEREPLIQSILLTKGKARQIASCLLLPAALVIIPWFAAYNFDGNLMDPGRAGHINFIAIILRSLLQTIGAIVISTGLCAIFNTLTAESGNSEPDDQES